MSGISNEVLERVLESLSAQELELIYTNGVARSALAGAIDSLLDELTSGPDEPEALESRTIECPADARYFLLSLKQGYVGNSYLWWRPNGAGYTCDLNSAGLYDRDKATEFANGEDNFAVPEADARSYVEAHVTGGMGKYVAMRNACRKRGRPERRRCEGCGRFTESRDAWVEECARCREMG